MASAEPKDGVEMRCLTEDHVTPVKFIFGWSLLVVVKAGYVTDGATVSIANGLKIDDETSCRLKKLIAKYFPGERIIDVYNRIVGTPWDVPRLLAAVVHDALYSIKWCCRFMCDRVYKNILKATNYSSVRREIEYEAIRLVGWRNWNSISKDEQEWAKPLVSVKWVKTKRVQQEIEKLKQKG